MAEYWEDWSGYTIGDDPTVDGPAGWTRRWHADETVSIVDISSDSPPTGFTRALSLSGLATDRRVYSLDAVDADADRATAKVAILCRSNSATTAATTYGGVVARGSGGTTSETGVNGTLTTESADGDESLNIGQYNSAAFTDDIKSVSGGVWSAGTWYWLVLDISGTSATLNLYPENDPGGTAIETHTRASLAVTAAGWLGFFVFSNSTDFDIAAVNIATGATSLSFEAPPSSGAKGVRATLFDGTSAQSSITGITAMWWDSSPPTGNPAYTSASESTDGSGVLEIDLDASTTLSMSAPGHLMIMKPDALDEKDNLAWQGRLLIEDIS